MSNAKKTVQKQAKKSIAIVLFGFSLKGLLTTVGYNKIENSSKNTGSNYFVTIANCESILIRNIHKIYHSTIIIFFPLIYSQRSDDIKNTFFHNFHNKT